MEANSRFKMSAPSQNPLVLLLYFHISKVIGSLFEFIFENDTRWIYKGSPDIEHREERKLKLPYRHSELFESNKLYLLQYFNK